MTGPAAGSIAFEERYGGPAAVLAYDGARAVVALQGAQVLSYEQPGLGELLWLSPMAALGTGKAVRGGIPVCWPWFGPHPQDGSHPAHGLVRARPWPVSATRADTKGARISFALTAGDLAGPFWPHTASVTLDVELSNALTVSITTRNEGTAPLTLTQALHTYLRISDIDGVRVAGLEDVPFIDQLDPGELKREQPRVHITREVDRIYQDQPGRVTLIDLPAARRITIAKTGSTSSVLWNPWIEKSARLGDMGENGYRRMVCIETANAGHDAVTLRPGARHTLVARISGERL